MKDKLQFYINGSWVDSESNEKIEVINPANEEIIGHVTAGTKGDIDRAVAAAFQAFSSFQYTSKEERIELLNNIISEYENRYDDFVQAITEEMGAPLWLSEKAQASTGIKNIHETLDALKDYQFEKPEGDYTLIKGAYWCYWHDHSMELADESNHNKSFCSISSRLYHGS
jgi:aldehyde dehydrogenase (NAD+)